MAYELEVKAWLMAEKAAVHGAIALKLASRGDDEASPVLEQAKQMSRALREGADSQFRDLLLRIAHTWDLHERRSPDVATEGRRRSH